MKKNKYYTEVEGKYPEKPTFVEDENNIRISLSASVIRKDNKYFLEYISGAFYGIGKTIEISEEEFFLAKEGKLSEYELVIRYNAY